MAWDYKASDAYKITEDFRAQFTVNIGTTPAIKAEGLTIIGHEKGIKDLNVEIIQFPNAENNQTCICKCVVTGVWYDPVQDKLDYCRYSDIGDANPDNCGKMTKNSFIRMASTRAISRTLRKYVNIDMVSSAELEEVMGTNEIVKYVTVDKLAQIKTVIKQKGITNEQFNDIMKKTFGKTSSQCTELTEQEGEQLLELIQNFIG